MCVCVCALICAQWNNFEVKNVSIALGKEEKNKDDINLGWNVCESV